MTTYVPGTDERDHKKQNMSLQQIGPKLDTNTANIATNTAAIATLNAATYVNSFKTRTGAVVPVQGDYPTSLIPGTTTNDSATAGNIGEYVESVILSGSAVSLVTGTSNTVTSISLTAGDWAVSGTVYILPAATANVVFYNGSLSGTTNTSDGTPGKFTQHFTNGVVNGGFPFAAAIPSYRISIASTTTVFLVANSNFSVSTCSAFGIVKAWRVR